MLSPVFLLAFPWTVFNSFSISALLERGGTLFASTCKRGGTNLLRLHPVPLTQPLSISRWPATSCCKMVCLTTLEGMIAVVYTCCHAWIILSTLKLWMVTRCIRPGRISLYWHTYSIKGFFQGGKVWLHCFQCCHQCTWLWPSFLGPRLTWTG